MSCLLGWSDFVFVFVVFGLFYFSLLMLLVLLMLLPLMLLKPLYNICRVRDSNPRLLDRNSCATKELHSLFRFFVIQIWTCIAFCQYVIGPNSKIFTFKCCFLTWCRGGIFQNKTLTSRRRNVNVCKSILHVDTSLSTVSFKICQTLTLETKSFKSQNVDVTSTF